MEQLFIKDGIALFSNEKSIRLIVVTPYELINCWFNRNKRVDEIFYKTKMIE